VPIDFAFSGMAERSDISPARWRRPFLRFLDGVEAGWAIPTMLAGFVAIWMAYLAIAYLGGDLHPDVLEAWVVGRTFEWGSPKHPPLIGWVTHVWTSVFPLSDWSFQLLALTNSAIALWIVDCISRRFVRGDKRIIVLLLLMLLPAYQFFAQRFNANAVLLATWPLATYCFLRSFETRRARWAVAAGATAALAILGKYYSVFLIGSFVFAAICHPHRRAYFGSLAPWLSTVAGLAVLGPHLHWLATTGATPLAYAIEEHAGKSFGVWILEPVQFILGLVGILALPATAWLLIAGTRLRRFSQDFRAMGPGLLLLFFISVGTIVFPVLTSIVLRTDLLSIWALQGLFLFSILIVCGTKYPIERFYTVNLTVLVIGIAAVAVMVVAPIQAVYWNTHPLGEGRNFYRLAAMEVTRRWHNQSRLPLPSVGGDSALAFAIAFYSPDHPAYQGWILYPNNEERLPPQSVLQEGWLSLCFAGDPYCLRAMREATTRSSRFTRFQFELQSILLGQPGSTRRFEALIIPPHDEGRLP
jgi:4-amino-4-deoxy-L-arabinose transferase-like glycosyltransferase